MRISGKFLFFPETKSSSFNSKNHFNLKLTYHFYSHPFQPVDAIATALGVQRGVHVLVGYLEKESSDTELKSVADPEQRVKLLKGVIRIAGEDGKLLGKTVLLVDDLFRSGATLNACCRILKEKAGVASVSVLTMTKTRSNR